MYGHAPPEELVQLHKQKGLSKVGPSECLPRAAAKDPYASFVSSSSSSCVGVLACVPRDLGRLD